MMTVKEMAEAFERCFLKDCDNCPYDGIKNCHINLRDDILNYLQTIARLK